MKTLICLLLLFSIGSAQGQSKRHSIIDLYQHTSRIYKLTTEGKSLNIITLCDSIIKEYKDFPGAEDYMGYLYIYMAEASKQQGDISLARYSYKLAKRFFKPGDDVLDYRIPVNLISLDLEAGRFAKCLSEGMSLIGEKEYMVDPAKRGTLLNNIAAAALQCKKYALADSLFRSLFELIHQGTKGAGFDTALTYRNYGRLKFATREFSIAIKSIRRSLDLYKIQYGNDHFQSAKSWFELGHAFKQLNNTDSANYYYLKARQALQTSDSLTGNSLSNSQFSLNYETIFIDLQLDEIDLQRIQACKDKNRPNIKELKLVLEKALKVVNRLEDIIQYMISSESGFFWTNKGRKAFDTVINTYIDLFKSTSDKEYLQQAYFWSLQSGSISLQASSRLDEKILSDDSTRVRTFRLYKIRELMENTENWKKRAQLLQEYQLMKRQLESIQNQSLYSESQRRFSVQGISKSIGKGCFIRFYQLDSVFMVFVLKNQLLSFTETQITDTLKKSLADFSKRLSESKNGNFHIDEVEKIKNDGEFLYRNFLKPFNADRTISELFIQPDGIILDLPFEALIVDKVRDKALCGLNDFRDLPFVIKEYCISYVSEVQFSPKKKFHPFHRAFLIISNPNDQLETGIKAEIKWLAEKMPNARMIDLGIGASSLNSSLEEANIIHFAGHIQLDQNDAFNSMIGSPEVGARAISLAELLHLRIGAEMVFINGCESAEGVFNGGDGKLSPGLFFLLAGAGGVVEHLWRAPDISGSIIAREFYNYYPSFQPAVALQKAKKNFLTTCQPGMDHPHYWAGMVYSGPLKFMSPIRINLFISLLFLMFFVSGILITIRYFRHRRHDH